MHYTVKAYRIKNPNVNKYMSSFSFVVVRNEFKKIKQLQYKPSASAASIFAEVRKVPKVRPMCFAFDVVKRVYVGSFLNIRDWFHCLAYALFIWHEKLRTINRRFFYLFTPKLNEKFPLRHRTYNRLLWFIDTNNESRRMF